jgi:hypothetical protein
MADDLESISEQLGQHQQQKKDPGNPPLQLWHPQLSGDIDIVIKADGSWIHEGRPIERQALVNLFASILRREEDGEYYLVTPVEKWRLQVEALPLVVIDFDVENPGQPDQQLTVTLNTERQYPLDADHPLFIPEIVGAEGIPAIQLPHGLAALFSRAAWYRLVEICVEEGNTTGLYSKGSFFPIAMNQE